MRERRPGVWEVRVAAGIDAVTGRVIQRSVTFHGSAVDAEQYCAELAAEYAVRATLQISTHTLQEHLRAVFDRFGVGSRRELVAALMV